MSFRKPFMLFIVIVAFLLGTGAGMVIAQQTTPAPAGQGPAGQAPAPYTAPNFRDVLGGKAPLRILAMTKQPMLAWKGGQTVRILRADDSTVLYTAKAGELVGLVRDQAGCWLRQNGKNFTAVSGAIRLQSGKPIKVWTPNPDAWSTFDTTLVLVPTADGNFTMAREMMLEEYLRNVVSSEMPSSFQPQALRAQAIIARTYALVKLGRHAAEGADLCATEHCQMCGSTTQHAAETDRAIQDTRGLVLMAGDKLAEPYYSATCGGSTDDAGAIWGPEYARPYLVGGPDMDPKVMPENLTADALIAGQDAYCKGSKSFHWVKQFTAAEVNALVAKNLPVVTNDPTAQIRTVTNMTVEERTPNGRVASLRVEGDGMSVVVFGDQIRWLFGNGNPGPNGLWSTLFDLTVSRDAQGAIDQYAFQGAGRGHGIGLCQWGANGRAQAGQGFREILAAYYPGTRLSDDK
jgi:SpoIID/LytB domain protein